MGVPFPLEEIYYRVLVSRWKAQEINESLGTIELAIFRENKNVESLIWGFRIRARRLFKPINARRIFVGAR